MREKSPVEYEGVSERELTKTRHKPRDMHVPPDDVPNGERARDMQRTEIHGKLVTARRLTGVGHSAGKPGIN